ncbi:hypothetical protein [Maliponia aquimaris]|nr:hypothetical protein [Maliponia aquimaris]
MLVVVRVGTIERDKAEGIHGIPEVSVRDKRIGHGGAVDWTHDVG